MNPVCTTRQAGYTLLEILVVLALFALILGISTPRLAQAYRSVQFSLEQDQVVLDLERLAYVAYQRGAAFSLHRALQNPGTGLIELPEGWQWNIAQAEQISYSEIGFCSGGQLEFSKENRRLNLQLIPPFCRVEVID